jgi:hypothetical protein
VAIGNGQLVFHLLAALAPGLLLLARRSTWASDLVGVSLVAVALAKPTIGVPFGWVAVFAPGRWRPAVLLTVVYAALMMASQFASGQ